MATVALASAAATAALTLPGLALAHGGHDHGHGAVPAPPAAPTSADQIQNIDQVKTAISAYYGDTVTATPDPVNGATVLHTYSPSGQLSGRSVPPGCSATTSTRSWSSTPTTSPAST